MDFREEIIEKKYIYKGDFLRIERVKVKLPDDNEAFRDIVRHPGAVAILAFIDEETVLLVKQFRTAVGESLYEIPAGKLEKGENPKEAALRELEEETGYKAGIIEELGYIYTGAGFTDQKIYIYKASDLSKGKKGGDNDEFIEVFPFKIQDIKNMIKSGTIVDTKTISSIMYL